MSDALKLKGVSSSRFAREIAPKSHRVWQTENEEGLSSLQPLFTAWLDAVAENEAMFKKFVYENDNLSEGDLRQHRIYLYASLHDGEELAFAYLHLASLNEKMEEVKPIVEIIDGKLKELAKILFSWHGPIESQSDVPESFKQATRETAEGKIVDLDV